jgi:hypothetical protein
MPDTSRLVWKFSPYGPEGETMCAKAAHGGVREAQERRRGGGRGSHLLCENCTPGDREAQFTATGTSDILTRSRPSQKRRKTQVPELVGLAKSEVSLFFENKPRSLFWIFDTISKFWKNISLGCQQTALPIVPGRSFTPVPAPGYPAFSS